MMCQLETKETYSPLKRYRLKVDLRHEEEAINLLLKTLKIIFLIQPKLIHGLNDLNELFS